ncbi:MAG: FAD binding domain-containing protein [Anaerolineales bacterium]
MKPAPFDYYAPTSLDEALDLLAQLGYDGKILAGGQSLIPTMNFRMAQPGALVDLNRIAELFYVRPAEDGGVLIGTMTRDTTVDLDPLVRERAPLINEAMPHIGHVQIRNRGTFGGSLTHADPAAQLPAISLALDARCRVRSKDGERWIPASDFYYGPFMPAIEPHEMLVEVAVPPMPPRTGWSYQQFSRQHGTQALVGVAVMVTLDKRGRCRDARIALLGVGEKVLLASEGSGLLVGEKPKSELLQAVAEKVVSADIDPGGDIHASADYRRHLTNTLTRRALSVACERARD